MSLFKKFTDFCGGIGAFMGGLFLIQKYMAFKPKTDEEYIDWISDSTEHASEYIESVTGAPSKISQFMTPELTQNKDYRPIVILTALLIISLLVSRIFQRLPYVCFTVSILPAIVATYLFCKGTLYNQPSLFIVMTLIPVFGNAVECLLRDRKDGRHRLWLCAKISMFIPSVLCLILAAGSKLISAEGVDKKLSIFNELSTNVSEQLFDVFIIAGVIYLVILVISTLLLNVYFIDMILSLIPLAYIAYQLYNIQFSVFIPVLLSLAIICFITNLVLCTFENNLSQKEQKEILAAADATGTTSTTKNANSQSKKNSNVFSKITKKPTNSKNAKRKKR